MGGPRSLLFLFGFGSLFLPFGGFGGAGLLGKNPGGLLGFLKGGGFPPPGGFFPRVFLIGPFVSFFKGPHFFGGPGFGPKLFWEGGASQISRKGFSVVFGKNLGGPWLFGGEPFENL